MQNIVKLKSYADAGNPNSARKDVYFNVEGFVSVKSSISGSNPGSSLKIHFLPTQGVAFGAYVLELEPGKNLVTQDMVDSVEDAVVENSVTPLAIADIQALIEPVENFDKVIIKQEVLPQS